MHPSPRQTVEGGDALYTIYAEKSAKLGDAIGFAEQLEPIRIRSQADTLVEQF